MLLPNLINQPRSRFSRFLLANRETAQVDWLLQLTPLFNTGLHWVIDSFHSLYLKVVSATQTRGPHSVGDRFKLLR